jgi:hypothetical protein
MAESERQATVCAFQAFTVVFDSISHQLRLKKRRAFLYELVDATKYPSIVHHLAIRYLFRVNCANLRYMTIAKNMIRGGIRDGLDILWIERFLVVPSIKKPMVALKFMFVTAASDRIWSRVATESLTQPLSKFHNLAELKPWVSLFMKRVFVFIGVSRIRQKYDNRMIMIRDFLEALLELELKSLTAVIAKSYAGLISRRTCPFSLPINLTGITGDWSIPSEVNYLARTSIKIKDYLVQSNVQKPGRPVATRKVHSARDFPKSKRHRSPTDQKVPIAIPKVVTRVPLPAVLPCAPMQQGSVLQDE